MMRGGPRASQLHTPGSAGPTVTAALPRGVRTARAIVVFGGTFDPVHRWHIAVAGAARRRAGPGAWLVFVPAARSPHKPASEGPRAPDADRVEMLRRATRRMVRAAVWTEELERGGASYTVDTLRRLRARCGSAGRAARVYLLIGADQAAKFHLWRDYRELMKLADGGVLVALRPPLGSAAALARALRASGAWSEAEVSGWVGRVVRCGVRGVSSTRVRTAAARGDGSLLRRLTAPAVAAWIRRRGLYRGGR